MQIRLTFNNRLGKSEFREASLGAIPPVGAVISEYASRPGQGNPVKPGLVLRVTGGPAFHVIGGWFRRTVDVLVPCEVVG